MVQLTFASGVDARIKCFTQLVLEAIDSLDPLVGGIGHGGGGLGRRVRQPTLLTTRQSPTTALGFQKQRSDALPAGS